MKMFLELGDNCFDVYSDTFVYIGFIKKHDNIWICHPEQRIENIDKKIVSEVDDILLALNS